MGSNHFGQLGSDSDSIPQSVTPLKVVGLPPIVDIDLGDDHTCAIDKKGSIWCWGNNEYGQLGFTPQKENFLPHKINELSQVKKISAGYSFNCALLASGNIKCWGRNDTGQLGTPVQDSSIFFKDVPLPSLSKDIEASGSNACAITQDDKAYCWGHSGYDLGIGMKQETIYSPAPVLNIEKVKQIVIAPFHTCFLESSGGVKCAGSNNRWGGLGNNNVPLATAVPVPVVGINSAVFISSDCALLKDHSMKCWGSNQGGKLGYPHPKKVEFIPQEVQVIKKLKKLSLGGDHTCGIHDDGKVFCWGDNWNRHIKSSYHHGTANYSYKPLEVKLPTPAEDIRSYYSSNCALSHGSVYCWGDLIDKEALSPKKIEWNSLQKVKQISVGDNYVCALFEDTTVKCFRGTSKREKYAGPILIDIPLDSVTKIASFDKTTCALLADGSIVCFKKEQIFNEELNKENLNTLAFHFIPQGEAVDISLSNNTVCALLANATIYCEDIPFRKIKEPPLYSIQEEIKWAQVSFGGMLRGYACFLSVGGDVYCSGESRDGGIDPKPIIGPREKGVVEKLLKLESLSGIQSIYTGPKHACALDDKGTAYCWGDNEWTQLGDGSIKFSPVPITFPHQFLGSNAL